MNRLRVKEIMAAKRKTLNDIGPFIDANQYAVAAACIPFNMTDASKAQLLAKWNNGKALSKLTCEVLFKLRDALGCTYGELIGTPYTMKPEGCDLEMFLIKQFIQYEEEFGNALDALVEVSTVFEYEIDFIFKTEDEYLIP